MATSSLLRLFFFYLAAFDAVMATYEYVYEFGRKREGTHVYDKEGSIGLFGYTTNVYLRVPRYTRVTYIKVIVYAISPPKVDFNEVTNVLTIAYSWVQITFSSYSVSAKAVRDGE
ncbi:uncharacterized protein [Choristoneura fumiferana]|uniref:uncharacterized protein n=1 Tax=Choristoneura fumiferana TaxID=7141 RepID=UPI003D15624A